jgi:hypothetical protein
MASDGGSGPWATAMPELIAYLDAHRIRRPITFSYIWPETFLYLTHWRIWPERGDFAYSHLRFKPGPFYCLWTGTPFEDAAEKNRFFDWATAGGGRKVLQRTFHNRAGAPVYWLYRLERSAARPDPPIP